MHSVLLTMYKACLWMMRRKEEEKYSCYVLEKQESFITENVCSWPRHSSHICYEEKDAVA